MKLALGTVQFGVQYGINNPVGVPSTEEVKSILSLASKSGIDLLDTAPAYGNAEEVVAKCGIEGFDIVTKFFQVKDKQGLYNSLDKSLQNLNRKSVFGLIAHNADELISNPSLWEALQEIQQKKLVQKIGYSLYNVEQLETLLALDMVPNLVQFPYSLLDRKFEAMLPQLKQLGAEIHVRSAFLQGLYFIEPSQLPIKLQPLNNSLTQLRVLSKNFGMSIGELALNFAVTESNIDKVVIGVYYSAQLQENIGYLKSSKYNQALSQEIKSIKVVNPELLNPATWSK